MKLAIMQPYFMPYLGYFQAISAVDKYILYDKVNFIKRGWINRNQIFVQNLGKEYITIPLKTKSSNLLISDVIIDNSLQWRKKILNLIYYNYKRAISFEEVYPLLTDIINTNVDTISEYNYLTLSSVCNFLDMKTQIEISGFDDYNEIENYLKTLGDEIRKNERIFSICKQQGADIYINAIGGQELYSKEEFKENGIDLYFIKMDDIKYKQFSDEFVPYLSIIDVLMHNGKEGTKELLNRYTLM